MCWNEMYTWRSIGDTIFFFMGKGPRDKCRKLHGGRGAVVGGSWLWVVLVVGLGSEESSFLLLSAKLTRWCLG